MTRPRALLFDLDGTLVDSRGDIAAACNAALVAHGRPALPVAAILPMVGDGARALVARALSSFAPPSDALLVDALATFGAYYLAHPCVHSVLLPGARDVLAEAATLALPCALVTNKPRDVTIALVEALGMTFEASWAGGDGPLKPAPDSVLAMIARLGVAAGDAWMIGDGPQDVGAGKAAGCFTVGVPGIAERARLLASGPDLVCESLHDLRDELRRVTPA
ncbi:phosphoglycolate phosphatase [soil metagenome]